MMSNIVEIIRKEIIDRSNRFEEETKGTKEEYNLYLEHVQYVYRNAVMIAKNKNVDKEVVELSALLHDIAMTDKSLDRSRHNEYGALIAEALLKGLNYPTSKVELIKKCILNHSSNRKDFRTTDEEKVLVNADAMAHFDYIDDLYALASKELELDEAESVKFVQEKLTKDYNEIDEEIKNIVQDKYINIMNAKSKNDLLGNYIR